MILYGKVYHTLWVLYQTVLYKDVFPYGNQAESSHCRLSMDQTCSRHNKTEHSSCWITIRDKSVLETNATEDLVIKCICLFLTSIIVHLTPYKSCDINVV